MGKYYDAMTETEQSNAVSQDSYSLRHIQNPSEAVKLAAAIRNGHVIEFIKNPSEAVCIAAVTKNGNAIQHIKSPSEAVCMAAVKHRGGNIRHIKNPSEAVCMAAVRQDSYDIQFIKTPSEVVQMVAVSNDGLTIQYIKNPSEAVQCEAVKSGQEVLALIPRPILDTVAATHLIHHPLSPRTPKEILDRAPEILEAHCAGYARKAQSAFMAEAPIEPSRLLGDFDGAQGKRKRKARWPVRFPMGDVYTIGLSINMTGEDLSRIMIEWIENHAVVAVVNSAGMAP